jgi:outer membrane protein TolC
MMLTVVEGAWRTAFGAEPGLPASQDLPELRLSLRDAIEAAVENSPKVKLVREKIEAARAQSLTQFGALLPNFSGSLNASNQRSFLGTIGLEPRRTDPFDLYDARGNLTQNLFSLSLIQRWRASRIGVEVAELDSEVTKRDTIATVALLYMEALRAEAAVKAGEANVELSRQLLTLVQNRRAVGEATRLDAVRQEVQLEDDKQKLLAARNDRDRAKLNLIRALGIRFAVNLVLTEELRLLELVLPTPQIALQVAMEHRVELKAQSQRMKLANLTLSAISSERLPSLAAQGNTGVVGNHLDLTTQTHSIGLVLSIPIFDGGQREARISESRSQMRQEMIRMKDVLDQVTLEINDALLTLESAREQVSVAKEGIRLALTEVELAEERFRVGVVTSIEVTNAQTSLERARDSMIEALFKFNAARVSLARAQGRLEDLY